MTIVPARQSKLKAMFIPDYEESEFNNWIPIDLFDKSRKQVVSTIDDGRVRDLAWIPDLKQWVDVCGGAVVSEPTHFLEL